jgi:alpha-tubulin suppressor-like RCC1 family protein
MTTRASRRRPWWALLALLATVACGPAAPTGPGLAALALTIDPNPPGFTPTPLTITATDANGAALTTFQGTITLELDDGTVSPATVALSGGTATLDVTLGATIGVPLEFSARHGAVEGRVAFELGPIPQVPGNTEASAAAALPFLPFRPRTADYAADAPDLPGLDLSFTTVTLVLDDGVTIGDLNALLARHGAGIVAYAPGPPGALAALRLPTADHAAMRAALTSLQSEPQVVTVFREHRYAIPDTEPIAVGAPTPAAARDGVAPTALPPRSNNPDWRWEREDQTQPLIDDNWNLERIRVPQLWNLNAFVDREVASAAPGPRTVGVLDGAFPDHPDIDFAARLGDFAPLGIDPVLPDHGLHVSGIIAARFHDGLGMEGVHPFALLVALRTDGSTGWGLAELIDRWPDLRVVNTSLGKNWYQKVNGATVFPPNPNTDAAAQAQITAEGLALVWHLSIVRDSRGRAPLVVAAAGNDSNRPALVFGDIEARWSSPMTNAALVHGEPDIVVVENVRRGFDLANERAPSSNVGGHVSAPGTLILSASASAPYVYMSGTSMATPHVAALASYLAALEPSLTNAEVRFLLTSTATPVFGVAPVVDAFAAAMAIDGLRPGRRILRALLDVDDGTPDGNTRIDPFSGAVAPPEGRYGPVGDGRIDMRDFRRFRDALLQVENLGAALDGEAHLKRDLNLDGRVGTPGEENVFPRFDFNGDGRVDRVATARVPGFAMPVTDLQVLQSLWEDDDVFAHELDELLYSVDVHVSAAEALADARVGAVEVEFRDEAGRGVRSLTLDRDRPLAVTTLPVDMYEAIIRLLDQGGLLLDEQTDAFGVGPGGDWAIRVDPPAPRGGQLLAAGEGHALALLADRTVVAWGDAILGDGNATGSPTPVVVAGLTDVVSVAAGQGFSLALKADGTVWSWGSGFRGKLGHGDTDDRLVPTRIGGLDGVVAIAAKSNHAMALRENGSVVDWGFMSNYEGSPGERSVPTPVPGVANAAAIQAGEFALVVLADGHVVGWGRNDFMQLGDGSTRSSATPVPALGIFDAIAVTGGATYGHALLADGTVAGWGLDILAGLGGIGTVVAPGPVTGPDVVVRAISSYQSHTLALTDDGLVFAWGNSRCGELGDGLGLEGVTFPLQIATVDNVVAVAAGFDFSLFALRDGSVRSVGCNRHGQLGDGTTQDRSLPEAVLGITNVAQP